jgi:ribosome-associated protein
MPERPVVIAGDTIKLDAFLKWSGVVQTGGEAKVRIQRGEISVNGQPERRRGRMLSPGDRVGIAGGGILVVVRHESSAGKTAGAGR